MEIKKINQEFSVCQVEDYSFVNLDSEYSFIYLVLENTLQKTEVRLSIGLNLAQIWFKFPKSRPLNNEISPCSARTYSNS